jgi:signal transduction histidine kinase
MISKLYKRLYIYAIIILITSIFLTIAVINIVLELSQKNVFSEHLINEARLVQRLLRQTYEEHPESMQKRVLDVSKQLNWNISVWKGNSYLYYTGRKPESAPKDKLVELMREKQPMILNAFRPPLQFLLLLDEEKPELGYIVLKFIRPQMPYTRISPLFFAGVLIMLFLALLLIPYSLYILRPFKDLMFSINRVSTGDFSTSVVVPKNSEFSELADAFNNMTFKIQEMIAQKQRLIADVSHELRSPLTRMRLSLEILSKDPEGRKKYIQKSISEIEQLDQLIQDLLDISKFELNTNKMNFEILDFKNLIIDTLEKHYLLFENHKIKIKAQLPTNTLLIKGDRELLERALNNIYSNLVKYAPADSTVDITLGQNFNNAVLTIRDRGPGIKEEEYDKIFEPFYRSDDSRSRKTGGTGLGLAIVKKIIQSHQGNIWASPPNDNQSGLVIGIGLNLILEKD